ATDEFEDLAESGGVEEPQHGGEGRSLTLQETADRWDLFKRVAERSRGKDGGCKLSATLFPGDSSGEKAYEAAKTAAGGGAQGGAPAAQGGGGGGVQMTAFESQMLQSVNAMGESALSKKGVMIKRAGFTGVAGVTMATAEEHVWDAVERAGQDKPSVMGGVTGVTYGDYEMDVAAAKGKTLEFFFAGASAQGATFTLLP
ncbi:hypothetical protein T484DRAFT_1863091, partial [Baffinella frigidus]